MLVFEACIREADLRFNDCLWPLTSPNFIVTADEWLWANLNPRQKFIDRQWHRRWLMPFKRSMLFIKENYTLNNNHNIISNQMVPLNPIPLCSSKRSSLPPCEHCQVIRWAVDGTSPTAMAHERQCYFYCRLFDTWLFPSFQYLLWPIFLVKKQFCSEMAALSIKPMALRS